MTTSCVTLLPIDERQATYIEESTNADAITAYERAAAQIARTSDRNLQILLQDKQAKRIILSYTLTGCAASNYLATEKSPSWHEFKLEIETKNNRARIRITDLQSWAEVRTLESTLINPEAPSSRSQYVFGPRTKEQFDGTVTTCIRPLVVEPLIAAIKGIPKDNDW